MAREMFSFPTQKLGHGPYRGWMTPSWKVVNRNAVPESWVWKASMNNRLQSGQMTGLIREAPTLPAQSSVHAQAAQRTSFETLQRRLTQDRLLTVDNLQHATHVKWAADEASSLAWATGYPLLFFPSLFEEKSDAALHRARRQDEIHARSRDLVGMTVGHLR